MRERRSRIFIRATNQLASARSESWRGVATSAVRSVSGGRIVAGEAMVGELRAQRIAPLVAHGAIDALDREEGERIRADERAHAFDVVGGGQELVALGRVDAVIVGMGDRGAGDAHVHLAGAGVAHHLHDLERGGAAHQRIVDQHDALAADHRAVGGMLHPHADLADRLGRLDEGAAHIVVADDAHLEGNARELGKADGGRDAGIRAPARPRRRRPAPRAPAPPPWCGGPRRPSGRPRSNPAARNRCIRRCRAAPASAGTACGNGCLPRRTPRSRRSRRRARIWRR